MNPTLEKVARALCESVGPEGSSDVRSPMGDWPSWHDWKPQARAALLATAGGVTKEMVDAFNKARDNYWKQHWVDCQDLGFSKTNRVADLVGITAALRKAAE